MSELTQNHQEVLVRDASLDVGGVTLALRRIVPAGVLGAGPTMVFLHKGLGYLELWKELPTALVRATDVPPRVRCPALLLQGREDEYATAGQLEEIASRLGGPSQAELMAECGHAPHLQAESQTLQFVTDSIHQTLGRSHRKRHDAIRGQRS